MLSRRGQMRHDKEVDGIPQQHRRQRDQEVSRKAHSSS
jgi:hypothetical protein